MALQADESGRKASFFNSLTYGTVHDGINVEVMPRGRLGGSHRESTVRWRPENAWLVCISCEKLKSSLLEAPREQEENSFFFPHVCFCRLVFENASRRDSVGCFHTRPRKKTDGWIPSVRITKKLSTKVQAIIQGTHNSPGTKTCLSPANHNAIYSTRSPMHGLLSTSLQWRGIAHTILLICPAIRYGASL